MPIRTRPIFLSRTGGIDAREPLRVFSCIFRAFRTAPFPHAEIPMMKRLALLLVLCAAFAATSAARSQQPVTARNQRVARPDSVKLEPSPELKQSLDDLAASVQALVNRIKSDPQLRADAIHVASGLVGTAQQVVTEQSAVLQEALKTAADKISAAQPPLNSAPKKAR
jgi:hypothetical protein